LGKASVEKSLTGQGAPKTVFKALHLAAEFLIIG